MAAAEKRLPYSYKSFLSSEMFTLRAGPSLKPFYVYKELLGQVSPELRRHIFNEMKEGQGGCMDMSHVSEETMCQFLEFCYTGNYTELDMEEDSEVPLQQLLPNARLYVLGDMYNIQRLKDVAFDKITAEIISFEYHRLDQDEVGIFIRLFEYALGNLPEREEMDPLLEYFGAYAGWALHKFRENEDFLSLLLGGNRMDFIKVIFSNLIEGESPWDLRVEKLNRGGS